MRLLHVHSGNLYGGVETLLVTLRRFADASSLEHDFALCFEARLATELRHLGAQLHYLSPVRTRHPLTVLRARRELRELLHARHFDAIICHMPWAQALFGPVVRAARVPLIFWMHDAASGRHWVERWARWTQPDLVLCNSSYTASTLPRLYRHAPDEVLFYPIEIDAPAIQPEARAVLRDELATSDDAVVIVQASRFEPWKGHFDHLEALGHLVDLPGWICWIVGGTQRPAEVQYLDRLKRRARELGLRDRIRFCGERSDVPEVMRAADIYCQPNSGAEPFGIVFAEALAAGLPIVTTALGGAAELINESCGAIAPPHNPAMLAERLRQLIADGALRDRLGAAGVRRVTELCDPTQQISRLSTIVGSLASSSTRRMPPAKPRVLHVAPAIFGEGDEFFGGAERYVYGLAQAMSRVVPTTLLTFGPKAITRQDATLRVEVLRNWIPYRRFRFDPFSPALLWRIGRADIVHYHQTYTMMSGVAALAGRVLRRPVFTTDAGAGGYGFHRFADIRNLYSAHLHISDFSRRHFGHENLASATVIHGGVNVARFSPNDHVRRTDEVLFVGRLLPHKGIDYLIDAVRNDIALRIIGRPFRHAEAYRLLLLRMAEGKRVTFDTDCSDADLLKAYRSALCIVLPSVYSSVDGQRHVIPELLGLALLEAMASGAPAICTNVTSLPEIVEDGVSGFIVPPNDPTALRERILWLRDNPDAAARMGDAARKRAIDHFAWEIAVRECLAAYARVSDSIPAASSDE